MALALAAYFLWPLPFSSLASDCSSITLISVDADLAIKPAEASYREEAFLQGSEEFARIQAVLADYSYHRSLGTLFSPPSLPNNQAGYWLILYLDTEEDREVLISGGSGEILFENKVYRMGYLGNETALSFMKEIAAVLA